MTASPASLSLAILKVDWDRLRQDYFENLVPFVAECVRLSQEDVISLPRLQRELRERFGLSLPQSSMRAILRRVSMRGFIQSENRVYRRYEERLAELGFREMQQEVLQKHDALIQEFISFCAQEFGVEYSTNGQLRRCRDYRKREHAGQFDPVGIVIYTSLGCRYRLQAGECASGMMEDETSKIEKYWKRE